MATDFSRTVAQAAVGQIAESAGVLLSSRLHQLLFARHCADSVAHVQGPTMGSRHLETACLQTAGFETMQQSALDILSDLLLRYIGEIGATAHSYAELSHRVSPSADDLVGAVTRVMETHARHSHGLAQHC